MKAIFDLNIIQQRLIVLTIICCPLFFIGMGQYPWNHFGRYGIASGMLCLFIVTILFSTAAFFISVENIKLATITKVFMFYLWLSCITLLCYDYVEYKHCMVLGYKNPICLYILDILILCLVTIRYKFSAFNLYRGASVFILLHLLLSIYYFPLVIARSDMFAAINISLNQFINHLSPYHKLYSNIGIPPYLPLTMLSFLPAKLLHVDFRFMSLVFTSISLWLIAKNFNRLSIIQQYALILLLINPYWMMRHDIYYQLFVLELVTLALYFSELKLFYRTILLTLTIATLQFGWIIAPFMMLYKGTNYRQILAQSCVSILLAGLLIVGYVHGDYSDFVRAIFLHKEYLQSYNSDITFSLATVFYFFKTQRLLYIFQISGSGLILFYALYHYKRHNKHVMLAAAALCYYFFIISNYFMETYLLMPMLLTLILFVEEGN